MAGFLIVFDNMDSLHNCIEERSYATYITPPSKPTWSDPASQTLGDYATMRPGDNLYFFSERKIYGIWEIEPSGSSPFAFSQECQGALVPQDEKTYRKAGIFHSVKRDGASKNVIQPWRIRFKPSPLYFNDRIDMDEMLASRPEAFRSLRCIEGLTFIKLDDEENDAFKTLFYRRNEQTLAALPAPDTADHLENAQESETSTPYTYPIDMSLFVKRHASPDSGTFQRETYLETSLLLDLSTKGTSAFDLFGKWDYLSHQVHASPAKPIRYMNKMDVFGYHWIAGTSPRQKMISRYLVIELKKDKANAADVAQLMRYIDWVCSEYADGDYSMVEGCLVAHDFTKSAISEAEANCNRYSIRAKNQKSLVWESIPWNNMALVTYQIEADEVIYKQRWQKRQR